MSVCEYLCCGLMSNGMHAMNSDNKIIMNNILR